MIESRLALVDSASPRPVTAAWPRAAPRGTPPTTGDGPVEGLLGRTLARLNASPVRYCVLRDAGALARLARGGEVDLLVDARDATRLTALLEALGFVALGRWGHAPHRFFVGYDADLDAWIKLDVVDGLAFGRPTHALPTSLVGPCLERRRLGQVAYVPAPEDELLTLLLHCVLDTAAFKPHRAARLRELAGEVTEIAYLERQLARLWSERMGWPRLAELIRAGCWTALLDERPAVARRLRRSRPLVALWRHLTAPPLRKLTRLLGGRWPRALSVALLAPDGAGKSTLADGLRQTFYFPVRIIYMGLYQKGATVPSLARLPGFSFAYRMGRQWARFASARYHQRRGRLVLFDRYTYDARLSPRRDPSWSQRLRRWLLAHACPPPDLVVLLDAPGAQLFRRKGEHDAALLEAQRQEYLALLDQLPNGVALDATADPERVRRDATALIWHRYGRRPRGAR